MARSGAQSIQPRSEVWHILHWLRSERGVKGIYELNVRDSCYLPHNERTIRECLRNFDIEVLDWRRLDLSLRVLFEKDKQDSPVCRNLRKLRLYAGGWPALAYWTSKGGLAQLDRLHDLRSVEIFVMREFVGGELSASYKDEADARIEDFKKEHPTSELQVTISTNKNILPRKPHTWPHFWRLTTISTETLRDQDGEWIHSNGTLMRREATLPISRWL
jgi:hypothetical protein